MNRKTASTIVCSKERELGIMATKIDNIENKMTEMHIDLKDFINAAEKKFASKLTERIVYGLVTLIVTAVITAIVTKALGAW